MVNGKGGGVRSGAEALSVCTSDRLFTEGLISYRLAQNRKQTIHELHEIHEPTRINTDLRRLQYSGLSCSRLLAKPPRILLIFRPAQNLSCALDCLDDSNCGLPGIRSV